MFLKLTQLPKGEGLLRIPDYVDKLVFHADEWTISEVGLSKPLVSYGPKSLNSTFNIAMGDCKHLNLSHFIAVTVGKLPSTQDVQLHYFNLAYAIKVYMTDFFFICSIKSPRCADNVPVNSKTAHPPRAIPGHLTRVKLRTVGMDECPDLSGFPYISLLILYVFKCLYLSQN